MRHTEAKKNESCILPCFHRYLQITGNKPYILPCFTQILANHKQQIVHLAMPHADTSKSQATNRTSCHASQKNQQITHNKPYFLHTSHRYYNKSDNYILPCFIQKPANQGQQIVLLATLQTDTSDSQTTNRTSCHATDQYQKSRATNRASKSFVCLERCPFVTRTTTKTTVISLRCANLPVVEQVC